MGTRRNQHGSSLPPASATARAAGAETEVAELTHLKLGFHSNLANNLSADEYARENCLSLDSVYDFVTTRLSTVIPLGESSFGTETDRLTDGSYPDHLNTLSSLPIYTDERFEAAKESCNLIDEVQLMCDVPKEIADLLCLPICPNVTQWALDQPILQTDLEYDCRELARSVSSRKNGSIGPADIPLETLNEANDESLSFPCNAHHRRDDITSLVLNENFDITRATFGFLAWQHQENIVDCPAVGMTSDYLSWEMVSLDS